MPAPNLEEAGCITVTLMDVRKDQLIQQVQMHIVQQ